MFEYTVEGCAAARKFLEERPGEFINLDRLDGWSIIHLANRRLESELGKSSNEVPPNVQAERKQSS